MNPLFSNLLSSCFCCQSSPYFSPCLIFTGGNRIGGSGCTILHDKFYYVNFFLVLQPKATLKFPLGEVSLEEKEEEETKRMLSINGIVKGQILNGSCTAHYADEDLKLRYSYKVSIILLWFFFLDAFQLNKMDDWVPIKNVEKMYGWVV